MAIFLDIPALVDLSVPECNQLSAPTVDELIDRVRALESALTVERNHRLAAEAHADACDQKLRALLAPVGWSGAERRRSRSVAKWDGLDRRVSR